MSQYQADVPGGGEVQAAIRDFFAEFYKASDDPNAHQKYAESFTKDGLFILGPKESKGRDEILNTRKGMWDAVAKRSHTPKQIFAYTPGSDVVMLHGHVAYTLKDGRSTATDWAARASFKQEDGKLKMDLYQVYLDTAASSRAQ